MRSARWTSPPPVGPGSTYDQVAGFLGKEVISSFRVVELMPGRSVTIESTSGSFPITVTRRVEPTDAGRTRVSAVVRGDPTGYYRLARPLLRWFVESSVRADYANLKRLLEAEPGDARPDHRAEV